MDENHETEIDDCIEGLDPHRKLTITSEMETDKSYDDEKKEMED